LLIYEFIRLETLKWSDIGSGVIDKNRCLDQSIDLLKTVSNGSCDLNQKRREHLDYFRVSGEQVSVNDISEAVSGIHEECSVQSCHHPTNI
jgi:hypothetical protein